MNLIQIIDKEMTCGPLNTMRDRLITSISKAISEACKDAIESSSTPEQASIAVKIQETILFGK